MVHFHTNILQFAEQGEKTGWTYIVISAEVALQLKPNNKKSFRVKGKLDDYSISGVALLPMGDGDFIIPINAAIRKGIRKQKGASVSAKLELDTAEMKPSAELMECLQDEPSAMEHFNALAKSHQNYFTKWINEAKTEQTKTRRIAQAVSALAKGWHFGQMLQAQKKEKEI